MPRPRRLHADVRTTPFERTFTQLAALVAVGAIGAGALSATAAAPGALAPAAVSAPTAHGVHRTPGTSQTRAVAGAVGHLSATRHAAAGHRPAHQRATPATADRHARGSARPALKPAATRWMPSGIGMWIYQWSHTNRGRSATVVARATHHGLSTLYLRTGSSWDGFNGGPLRRLLAATRHTSIHVVAWDFPRLRRPHRDALRLAHAAHVTVGADHRRISAVAPDIETPAEGTFNAGWRVRAYLRTLRRHLPAGVSVLTAVPWPSRYRIGDYPYGAVAAHSDVLIPMAYWYNNAPDRVTARSIRYLRRFHRPVAPVGQGYDGRLDVPGLRHNNLSKQLPQFLHTAHRVGARAVSVWSWQSAPRPVWKAISRNHHLFAPGRSHH